MKLSRGLFMLMLISGVLDVLAHAGSRWVTWPERTARRFVERMAKCEINPMLLSDQPTAGSAPLVRRPLQWPDLKPQPRSPADLLLGRCRFQLRDSHPWNFTAERGSVCCPWATDIQIQGYPTIHIGQFRPDGELSGIEGALILESIDANQPEPRSASPATPADSREDR